MENTNKPTYKARAGNVTATVFTNIHNKNVDGKPLTYSIDSIVIEKSYKDGQDWKTTKSFNVGDLQRLRVVLNAVEQQLLLAKNE